MTDLDADGYLAALKQMRLVLLCSGATLSEADRHAPGLTHLVLGEYFHGWTGKTTALPLPPPPVSPSLGPLRPLRPSSGLDARLDG